MKSKLLLSTAALVAGIGLATAQDMPRGGAQPGGQPGGAVQSQGAPGAGGQDRQQSPQNRGGQAQQDQGKQGQKDQGKQGQTQRDRDQTTGQGQREQSPSTQGQREQSPSQMDRGQRDQGQAPQRQQEQRQQGQQAPAGGQAEQGRSGASSTVNLTTEQRTKIRQTVLVGGNAPRVSNVNFDIRVGTVVPTSVRVVEVAPVLVEIHPEWRGYMYFVVGDQIIIVDRNHRIVAVLEV